MAYIGQKVSGHMPYVRFFFQNLFRSTSVSEPLAKKCLRLLAADAWTTAPSPSYCCAIELCELRVKVGSSCDGRDNSSSPRRPSTSWTSTYIFTIDWLRYAVSERTALVDLPGTFRANSSSKATSFLTWRSGMVPAGRHGIVIQFFRYYVWCECKIFATNSV